MIRAFVDTSFLVALEDRRDRTTLPLSDIGRQSPPSAESFTTTFAEALAFDAHFTQAGFVRLPLASA